MKGTIKSKRDMERLFREGRRSSSYLMTILACPVLTSASQTGRCAFVAGKKLGVAPFRNRCKRVMREAAHDLDAPWNGYDVVFNARRKVASAPHDELVRVMKKQLAELGVVGCE